MTSGYDIKKKEFRQINTRRIRLSKRFYLLLFFLLCSGNLLVNQAAAAFSEESIWNRNEIAPGIIWKSASFDSLFGARQYVNALVLHADTAATRFYLATGDAVSNEGNGGSRRYTASRFASSHNALAVVNAGFFSDHPEYVSSGIFKNRGKRYPFMKEEPDELHFVGSSAIGIDKEGNWLFYDRKGRSWDNDWPEAHTALAGAHRLLMEGELPPRIARENYVTHREKRHAGLRHPRTAICLTGEKGFTGNHIEPNDMMKISAGISESNADETPSTRVINGKKKKGGTYSVGNGISGEETTPKIVIVVVDGRHKEAVGLTLQELALLLREMGCQDAINLDGGGSSTMYINGYGVVNHPSGNAIFDHEGERAVRTVILIK